ncbi:Asp23/Gls24 family envelope stress response protein [Streptomyces sp. CC208A]|uniref:Asp23/Gls24 family envelope stress response protein n=1 Tax=Streptomyces sp. CC208A TaxID=3044573 RepID=UPI0024A97701|nr:Asp23/Gls24 family envelope stress response protein [Streptomyces sp. CC208A]
MAMNTPHPHENPDENPDDKDLELLACGRDLATVWEHADRPDTDPHTATCPSCRQAVADLEHLRAAVLPPAAPPTDIDTTAVVRRVMDAVRLELRPGRTLPLGETGEDSWIYESVAARTLRTAAEQVPGVLAGSCRITPPGSRTHPTRGPSTVHLRITVAYGQDLPDTICAVRESLIRAARQHLGLALGDLDVTVTDLHDPPTQPQEARP